MSTFEEIYAETHLTMFRVAKKMIGDCDDVPDIIQEVFIDLFKKLNNGSEIRHPKSWLYRATFNKCVDNLRKQKRFQNIESIEDCRIEQESLEKQEIKSAINSAISKLKPREKMLAILYSEGYIYGLQILKKAGGVPLRLVRFKISGS